MPSPLAVSRGLLLFGICICNIESIVILRLVIFAHTAGPFEILAAVSSTLALLVFPITLCCKRHAEASNTRNLITFGALWLLDLPSCITLTIHARQNNATALCHDLSQSGDCTMANILIGCYYASVIFAIIGFAIAYIDKHPGIPKVSLRYPITQAASSPFAYTLDMELGDVHTEPPTGKVKHAGKAHEEERWTEIPV
ncbi:hypothetical protein EDB19DRAFT_1912793 [Suillus lakei]|nr:hypothetical protein EDB19DRAFT_1912793 [Suillus lakei]